MQRITGMQTIKPGTRKQLLSVFTPEGGLSEVTKRTYRSRDCLSVSALAIMRLLDFGPLLEFAIGT
jgi:hypothetical protein